MKHLLLILISFLLLSSPVIGNSHKGETLYLWETSSGWVWKTMGDKNNNTYYQGEIKREYILFGDYIFEGLGSLIFLNGNKYVGEWKNGKQNGQGTYTWSSGQKYVGEWKNGKQNGQGTETLSNGNKYVGEWKDGKYHGQGTITWTDGSKYVGEWKNGKQNGQGTETLSNGNKYVGEYKDGFSWNVTKYDKDGNILHKIVNGKWIK